MQSFGNNLEIFIIAQKEKKNVQNELLQQNRKLEKQVV